MADRDDSLNEPMPSVTDDAFLDGRLRVFQPRDGYRAGIDAVLLAAAARTQGETCLDIGAGVGVAGLCLAVRDGAARVVLFEKEETLAGLSQDNIERNGLKERVRAVRACVGDPEVELRRLGLSRESFGQVIANPPFHARGRGTPSRTPLKDAAHAMDDAGLDAWARFAARMTAPDGTLTLIHKATALDEILIVLRGRFGALRVLPIHPRQGDDAIRVIVQGVKGSRAPPSLAPGLVLHGASDGFTPEADAILRRGEPLRF